MSIPRSLRFKLTENDINYFGEKSVNDMAASKEIDENIKHNLINAPSVGKEKFIKLEEGFIELVKLLTF